MIIKEITVNDAPDFERPSFTLEVNGKREMFATTPEPEDASICRDLSFVYDISSLMKIAYDAGKRGEEFNVDRIETD